MSDETPDLDDLSRSFLAAPYLVSESFWETEALANEDGIRLFLWGQHSSIEKYWVRRGEPRLVVSATTSLLTAAKDQEPSDAIAALYLLRATAALAQASTPDEVRGAERSAQSALDILEHLPRTDRSVEMVEEGLLLVGVARKATGRVDDGVVVLRSAERDWRLTALERISVERQQVMMTLDVALHAEMLAEAGQYRMARTDEYFRTLKRCFEFLMNRHFYSQAEELIPELMWAFWRALPELSHIARVSFLKNLGQLLVGTGQLTRGARLLAVARGLAEAGHFEGQIRQIRSMLGAIRASDSPRMPTFRVG